MPPDSVRAALDSVFSRPEYVWSREGLMAGRLQRLWGSLIDWLAALETDHPLFFRLFVVVLVTLLIGILAHGVWVAVRTVRRANAKLPDAPPVEAPSRRDAAWYWREADRLASSRCYADAMLIGFAGVARTLDERGLAEYRASRTPAELVMAARVDEEGHERLRDLVRLLYTTVFGGVPMEERVWEAWRTRARGKWNARVR